MIAANCEKSTEQSTTVSYDHVYSLCRRYKRGLFISFSHTLKTQ